MGIENKFYTTDYELTSPYFKSDYPTTIMVASDVHYQPSVSRDLFRQLVWYARETLPDIIVIPGDLIETIDFIDNSDDKEFFESIIRGLAEIAPVVIVPGNHEIKDFSVKNFKGRLDSPNDEINHKALKYFDKLGKMRNVYYLNNEQTTIKGATFFGFNPRLSSYLKMGDPKTEEEFKEDWIKSGLKMAEADYNVLITHSDLQLLSDNVYYGIEDFSKLTDFAITGHWHDAYLAKPFDKLLGDTNAGLFFTPLIKPYPGILCRGVHDFGRGYLFISQGYRKWTADVKLFNFFERFTANDIENLIISKGEGKSIITSTDAPISTRKI